MRRLSTPGDLVVVVVIVDSKPPASPPEVSWLNYFTSPSTTYIYMFSCITGKAPRKQLATKAARKTAVVSTAFPHPTYTSVVLYNDYL